MARLRAILRLWPGPTRPFGNITCDDSGIPFLRWRAELQRRMEAEAARRQRSMRSGPDFASGTASNAEIDAAALDDQYL